MAVTPATLCLASTRLAPTTINLRDATECTGAFSQSLRVELVELSLEFASHLCRKLTVRCMYEGASVAEGVQERPMLVRVGILETVHHEFASSSSGPERKSGDVFDKRV